MVKDTYLLTFIVIKVYIYNGTTETVDYDAIGNPTTYRGASLAFNGRQLTSYNDGTNVISYTKQSGEQSGDGSVIDND